MAEIARSITYHFRFADGDEKTFRVCLDPQTLAVVDPPRESPPEWTRLSVHQCRNCPLDPALHPRCPIAVRVVDLVEAFRDSVSFEDVEVEVQANQRTYVRRTSLQKGLSSILGVYTVSSGCPIMNKLRPMVANHLPFASAAETTYRTIAMYLLAQYFRKRWGAAPDFELRELPEMFDAIREVDVGLCERLGALGIQDASLNALAILTTFGEDVTFTVLDEHLESWEEVFREHYG
ncbi:MAG: hypothetical protein HZB55_06955 [Deltaproteobacteria bacterium]|nr:hypothetical protein [Deltaproteobacteria bacterium]